MGGLSKEASKQGELWGRGARDYAAFQEPMFAELWSATLDAAHVEAGVRVLDAGCGAGGACAVALTRGAIATGVDAAAEMIAIARARVAGAQFRIGEIDELPFADGEFEAVVAVNALQTAVRSDRAVSEFARVCRVGGRVAIAAFADPAASDVGRVFRAIRGLFERPPAGGGPFALSAEDAPRALVDRAAALRFESMSDAAYAYRYPDMETALRGMMSAGGTWRAAEILGEDRVRDAVRVALEGLRQPDGTVRMTNRFRIVAARRVGGSD